LLSEETEKRFKVKRALGKGREHRSAKFLGSVKRKKIVEAKKIFVEKGNFAGGRGGIQWMSSLQIRSR